MVLVVIFCFLFHLSICSRLSSFSTIISLTFPTRSYASVLYVPLFMSFKIHVCVCVRLFLICINDIVL